MMKPDQAQRHVDFVAGGTVRHAWPPGTGSCESIFPVFAPKHVAPVTHGLREEPILPPTNRDLKDLAHDSVAPQPLACEGRTDLGAGLG